MQIAASSPLLLVVLCITACGASSLGDSVQPLFSATESFLDLIQPVEKSFLLKELVPELINGTLFESWRGMDVSQKAREYVQSMLGFAILIAIGLFLIILVPLAGCCVCCCRCCCGKCGGKLSYMERRGARCRRTVYGLLFLACVTAVLFGAVLALVSNQLLREQFPPDGSSGGALDAFSGSLAGVTDSLASVPSRGREVTPRLVSQVVARVTPVLNRTLQTLQDRLLNASDAAGALDAARVALARLEPAGRAAGACVAGHAALQASVAQLNGTLAQLRAGYFAAGSNPCPGAAARLVCDFVNRTLGELRFDAELPGGAELAGVRDVLAEQNTTDLRLRLDRAWADVHNVSSAGMEMVNKYLTDAQNSLNGSDLMRIWDRLDVSLQDVQNRIGAVRNVSRISLRDPITGAKTTLAELAATFDSYRYYLYLGLSSLVLLFVVLFYFGLLFGCTGEPPYEDSSCCNRGVGANFLLAGTALAFLFYASVMCIVMLLFLTGGLTQTEACRYLRNRSGANGYEVLDAIAVQALRRSGGGVALGNLTINLTRPVSTLLSGCAPNNSLTAALDLDSVVRGLGVPASIDGFLNNAKTELIRRAGEFVPQGAFNLTQLSNLVSQTANATAFDAAKYNANVSRLLDIGAASSLARALLNISDAATDASEKSRFGGYHRNLTLAIGSVISALTSQLLSLTQLSSNLSVLNSSVTGLPERVSAVGAALSSPTVLRPAIDAATAGLSDELLSQARWALDRILASAVDCPALGRLLRQLIDVPCARVLQPFNGFWAGLGICLIGLLPCLVLAIKLANLYRKEQKYLPDMDDRNPRPV